MEFKGTKGKWIVRASTDYSNVIIIRGEQYAPSFKDNKYNAQLVSKAPEMLEMLKIYLADLNNIFPKSDAQRSRICDVEQLIKEATEL